MSPFEDQDPLDPRGTRRTEPRLEALCRPDERVQLRQPWGTEWEPLCLGAPPGGRWRDLGPSLCVNSKEVLCLQPRWGPGACGAASEWGDLRGPLFQT